MVAELTHEQAAEEIESVALGLAPEEVSQAVATHASACAECAGELRSFYNVVTALSALIPPRELNRGHSAGIKSRLLAKAGPSRTASGSRGQPRVEHMRAPELASASRAVEARAIARAADRTPRRVPRVEEAAGREDRDRSSMPIWIAVVATLIALGSLAAFLNSRGNEDGAAEPGISVADPPTEPRVEQLQAAVAEKDATIAALSGPGVRIISLYNREAREPLGRIFWDRRSNRWTLFIYNLRQPRPGRTFRVWLGTDEGRVALGSFAPAADGSTTYVAEHALSAGALNTVSISEEELGSTTTGPTGPVVLAGALR